MTLPRSRITPPPTIIVFAFNHNCIWVRGTPLHLLATLPPPLTIIDMPFIRITLTSTANELSFSANSLSSNPNELRSEVGELTSDPNSIWVRGRPPHLEGEYPPPPTRIKSHITPSNSAVSPIFSFSHSLHSRISFPLWLLRLICILPHFPHLPNSLLPFAHFLPPPTFNPN